jgi:hypothetical protein
MDGIASGDDLGSVLKPRLYPGESLVWVGRPSPERFRGGIVEEVVLGISLTLLGTVFAAYGCAALRERTTGAWLGMAVGLLVATGGIRGLSAPIRSRRALADAVYAVTTERAVTVNGFGCARRGRLCRLDDTDRWFHYATVRGRAVMRHRRDGSGDIVFDSEWRRGRRHRYRVEIGFFGVPEVDRVDAHLGAVRPGPLRFDLG